MIKLRVDGMTCGHCEETVRRALLAVPGVEQVTDVSHVVGEVSITGRVDAARLIAAIRDEGYEAKVES